MRKGTCSSPDKVLMFLQASDYRIQTQNAPFAYIISHHWVLHIILPYFRVFSSFNPHKTLRIWTVVPFS